MNNFAEPEHKPQGATVQPDGVHFNVWAPRAEDVTLVVWFGEEPTELPMQPAAGGYFEQCVPEGTAGMRYGYRLNGGEIRPDPASRWQPDGVNATSAVFDVSALEWRDADWPGVPLAELVIYELHVGTFTPEGTFAAVIPRLDSLRELGVRAIEIMPVAQFSGERNWGYDGVHPCAAQNSYGGPQGLQELVDAAHRAGLAVILDVVYNHLGPEGNYLHEFGYYFTDRYHTPWGSAINYDGPHCDPVRRFVCDNARMWVRDFHVDGLRLDAIQTIYDFSARHILADVRCAAYEAAAAFQRPVHVIGETNQNDARLTARENVGGIALDAVWSDDFHHSIHALLTGEREGYYADFGRAEHLEKALNQTFVYDGCYSPYRRRRFGSSVAGQDRERFVVCIQNHDQIGNRALGERLDQLVSPAARRLAAALLLLAPGTPLLFMGEEYGETNPFPFFCSFEDERLIQAVRRGRRKEFEELDFDWGDDIPDAPSPETFESAALSWHFPEGSPQARLREMYRVLLHARGESPLLEEHETVEASLLNRTGERAGDAILVYQRGPALAVFANLTKRKVRCPPRDCGDVIFSTEDPRYGGDRTNDGAYSQLLPHELIVCGDADAIGITYEQQAVDA